MNNPVCKCHDEPMDAPSSLGHGGWGCRVKRRDRQRRYAAGGRRALTYAHQLLRGGQIKNTGDHHSGVTVILGLRLQGMEVSRVCPDDCPESWGGYAHMRGKKLPYRLCVPIHYTYETHAENEGRKQRRG